MKKIFFLVLFIPCIIAAQYNYENTTEQGFEELDIYFSSHYLNTFGINNFKNLAVGFIDNPFLNLQLNPANIPDLGKDKKNYFYLDFRGDRTEAKVVSRYHYNYYTDVFRPYIYPDPRYLTITREEPEPIFSFGMIAKPNDKSYISGSYQMLHRKEKFYSTPYYIYYPYYNYDSFGTRAENTADIPVEDIYQGKDEMILRGHFFTGGLGYKINKIFSAGAGFNLVLHEREGDYINNNNDEYGDTDDREWHSLNSIGRNQDYDHLDLNAGLIVNLSESFSAGLKIGYLNGQSDQDYNLYNSYFSQHDEPYVDSEWNLSKSDHNTTQVWKHDGNTKYFRLNFNQIIKDQNTFSGFYSYSNSDIDITNSSTIYDSSMYSSRYYNSYYERYIDHYSRSYMHDLRNGFGDKTKNSHEILIRAAWQLAEKTSVRIGFFTKIQNTETHSVEDAVVFRESEYRNNYDEYYERYLNLDEIKTLTWNYESKYWTFQIPIFFNFQIADKATIMIGVSRILEDWRVTNQTLAYFEKRERVEDGATKQETNFIERYTKAPQNFTEDRFDLITSFEAAVSEDFKINLIVDPDSDVFFRIAQWWLSFHANI